MWDCGDLGGIDGFWCVCLGGCGFGEVDYRGILWYEGVSCLRPEGGRNRVVEEKTVGVGVGEESEPEVDSQGF